MQEIKYEKLGWKTFWIFVSERSKIASVIGLLAIAASLFSNIQAVRYIALGLIGAFLIALAITILFSYVEYLRYGFYLDENALRIKRGVIHHEEIAIPYNKIQNADIERNFLYQLTGVSKLAILTAGQSDSGADHAEAEGVIPVIDKRLALRLQTELLTRANIQKVTPAQA